MITYSFHNLQSHQSCDQQSTFSPSLNSKIKFNVLAADMYTSMCKLLFLCSYMYMYILLENYPCTKSRHTNACNTKNLNTILIPRNKTANVCKSLLNRGPQIWINLTDQKRTCGLLHKFKKDTKRHIHKCTSNFLNCINLFSSFFQK